jgi:hypothetical protein
VADIIRAVDEPIHAVRCGADGDRGAAWPAGEVPDPRPVGPRSGPHHSRLPAGVSCDVSSAAWRPAQPVRPHERRLPRLQRHGAVRPRRRSVARADERRQPQLVHKPAGGARRRGGRAPAGRGLGRRLAAAGLHAAGHGGERLAVTSAVAAGRRLLVSPASTTAFATARRPRSAASSGGLWTPRAGPTCAG